MVVPVWPSNDAGVLVYVVASVGHYSSATMHFHQIFLIGTEPSPTNAMFIEHEKSMNDQGMILNVCRPGMIVMALLCKRS